MNGPSFTDATNQRTKKPAINDNTIADTPPFVETAPLWVEVVEGSALAAEDPDSPVLSAPVVVDPPLGALVTVDPLATLATLAAVVAEPTAGVDVTAPEPDPELTAVALISISDEGIVTILVVDAVAVGVRVTVPIR